MDFPQTGQSVIILRSGINTFGGIRRPLMATLLAQIFLMTM